jgi:hypothetical protein
MQEADPDHGSWFYHGLRFYKRVEGTTNLYVESFDSDSSRVVYAPLPPEYIDGWWGVRYSGDASSFTLGGLQYAVGPILDQRVAVQRVERGQQFIGEDGYYYAANTVSMPQATTKEPKDEDSTTMAKEIIEKFVSTTPEERKAMVLAGFELETQETDGLTDGDGELDHDAFDEAVNEGVNDILRNHRSLRDRLSSGTWDSIVDEVTDEVRANMDDSDYCIDGLENMRDRFCVRNMEVGSDSSVNGFEFRTRGGLSYADFRTALVGTMAHDHTVDEGCSFHIHLSLPGVKHKYGAKMQAAMVEYIAERILDLPEGVQNRLSGTGTNNFIKGLFESREKYSFVNYHRQGTWEFRCFGNVNSTWGGMVCLDIAIEALAHAYKVVRGEAQLVLNGYTGSKKDLVYAALSESKPLTVALREMTQDVEQVERQATGTDSSYANASMTNSPEGGVPLTISRVVEAMAELREVNRRLAESAVRMGTATFVAGDSVVAYSADGSTVGEYTVVTTEEGDEIPF